MIQRIVLTALLAGCAALVYAEKDPAAEPSEKIADPNTYLADFRTEAKKKWPDNRMLTVDCHGHSVPAGYFRTPIVDTFNAYPHLLHRAIKEAYPYAVVNVIVTAIGGEQSVSGAARFEKDVLSHKPDVLLIDYALNDRQIGLEKARIAWSQMIEAAQKQGVKVILLTPTADVSADMNNPLDPLTQHAEQIRSLARRYHVGLADSYARFTTYVAAGGDLKTVMSQGNHPNRSGHALVLEELRPWFVPPIR